MISKRLDLEPLQKALTSLEKAIDSVSKTVVGTDAYELARDGAIQRFEYTFELSWKNLKRYLEVYSLEQVDSLTGKDLFRRGFEEGLISDPEAWFAFKTARNMTSHIYNSAIANDVYNQVGKFTDASNKLLEQLRHRTQ
jgi:nucleotidyltransferase substrate binding protein (TIGR01987 family)